MESVKEKKAVILMEYAKSTPNMNVFQCKGLEVVTSVYVHKSFSEGLKAIKVTIEPA